MQTINLRLKVVLSQENSNVYFLMGTIKWDLIQNQYGYFFDQFL